MTTCITHQGDCRIIMPGMVAAIADCCITDPPYGDTSLPWDSKVDGWVEQMARIVKPNGSLWIFGSMRFLAPLFAELAAHGFKYSQDIVWKKQNGTGFHTDRFRRVHEHAVLFYRGAWGDVYHDTQYTLDATAKTVRRKKRVAHFGDIGEGHYVSEDGGPRMMTSVFEFKNEHGRAVHPTQKPVDLIRPLVCYSCPPGGIVLDPFMGSAAHGMAAIYEGRGYIGIEEDAAHYPVALARLAEAKAGPAQQALFTPPQLQQHQEILL